jgi:carbonic anhydrase
MLVQVTSGSNVAARVRKITEHENLAKVREANMRVVVHGWRKDAKGVIHFREVDLS